MAKNPAKHGSPWTSGEVNTLRQLVKKGTATRMIASKMKRSFESVRSKAKDLKIRLGAKPKKSGGKRKRR